MPVLQFYLISPPALKEDLVSMARKGGRSPNEMVRIDRESLRRFRPGLTDHLERSAPSQPYRDTRLPHRPQQPTGVRSGNRSVTAHALSLKPFPDLGSLCPLLSIQQSGLVTRNHQGAQAPALRYSWRFFVPGCFVLWRLCVGRLRARRFP